ncbi:unnamed protein product (macronuclear) [Paramecium tetraurelia]|uniref:peptide-methionine (S)-S-oxide reductase n=1 Tax=Paramecium tetraurelia TaxID=5888 RepID=A0D8Z4_PARTE|nr:uncharacterized protein GSPATT00014457001 [Paramecium tetraurelia]CAK79511.1 unnamed protein product [Paramecium tetraurelia]|eukprot:XP_001446908.1 hypothetical protein (macronuclear) [Paramecium tetraurelia strain d4-2]
MTTINKATLGGGCFWCIEAVFKRIKGVNEVYSGYAGGANKNTANYKDVCRGDSGHAEVVQITYDESKLKYYDLLTVFFNSHDPTTLNRQGNDQGHQYRSIIFYHNEQQRLIAVDLIKELSKSYKNPIVTEIVQFQDFYKAENYHQDYYDNNKNEGYCKVVIKPKLEKIVKLFKDKLKQEIK